MWILWKFLRRYKRYFHKFIETSKNRRQLKYVTKTSCHKSFRKKDRDKRYIKNLRPISLLNIDTKKSFLKPFLQSVNLFYLITSLQMKLHMWKKGALVKAVDWYLISWKFVIRKICQVIWSLNLKKFSIPWIMIFYYALRKSLALVIVLLTGLKYC